MEKQFNKKINNLTAPILIGSFFIGTTAITGEKISHELPIQNINKNSFANEDLSKMPLGNIEAASRKVNINRNPFQDLSETEFINVTNLNSSINFKGLVKSDEKLMAIIYTKNGQKLYSIGEDLGNGFFIKAISLKDVTVDISNGVKNYRLSLSNIKSQL